MPYKDKQKKFIYDLAYREANKERIKARVKIYRDANKDKITELNKRYVIKNKTKKQIYDKKYAEINAIRKKETAKIYYQQNKERIKARVKIYRDANKYKRNIYDKTRKAKDPLYKLTCNLRSLIKQSVIKQGYKKSSKTQEILGCTFEEFKVHLESKFESWMTWDNYGLYNGEFDYGWDIDHVIPLSSVDTIEDIIRLNNYVNLQPLCSKVNREIKRNII